MLNKNKEGQNRFNLFLMNYFVLIVLATTAFAVYFGYFFIVKPKESDIESNIKIAISEKERDLVILQDVLNKINAFQSAYERISENEKNRLDVLLPAGEAKNNLFSDIENMILRQGFILDSIEIEEKNNTAQSSRTRESSEENKQTGFFSLGQTTIVLKISGVGNYEKMKKLIELFENNLRLMDVKKIEYNSENSVIGLEITTYFLKT